MEPRLFRLTVVLAALAFLLFATLAGVTAKDYFSETSNAEGWRMRARLEELEKKEAAANPTPVPMKLYPFNGELDDPNYQFDWKKMESDSKRMAANAYGQMIHFLLAALYLPATIFSFFYTVRWILVGKLRPWIPK
ncbi:hypothetical protein RugamoR64_56620 [Duganella rhizosphaerae]|uniref:hypothetical protein n=1 Tax=Duganella rhizosphaerae TaxID=2885763 RepID=UPI0030E9362D